MIDITEKKVPHLFRNKYLRNGNGSVNISTQSPGQSTPGGSVDIIKSDSATVPGDSNVLSSLRALLEIRSRIVSSTDEETVLTEENTLSSLYTIAEIDSAIKAALKDIEALYLSKTKADTAAEAITFLKGLFVGDNLAFIDANGDAEVRNIVARIKAKVATLEVTGDATTLNLLVQQLATIYDLDVTHVATIFRTIIKDYVSSETFIPGLMGEGMKIYKTLNGDWNLEVDNVVVRKVMTIFELVISKIRAVNGGLVISPANGRIKSVAETTGNPTYYVLGIEGDMPFVFDDLVRCQVFTTGQVKYYWVPVASVTADSILVLKSEFANGVTPVPGDDLIQMGNRTNTARQGLLYLTASEDGKPRFSVMDGIDSTSLVGKSKVILGCLDGMTDTDFPADFQPSGYGLYAMNVFLKGVFLLRNGKTVESELNTTNAAVTAAKQIADAAKELANSANALLSDIASDNKLTPSEKQQTKKEWDVIVSEKPLNNASSVKFGISTLEYDTAYNALSGYISPLLTSLTDTSDITGSTFRSMFKAYYDARTNLLNAVSEKAKRLADDAQNAANVAQAKADTVDASFQQFIVAGGQLSSIISETKTYADGKANAAKDAANAYADGKVDGLQVGGRNYALGGIPERINGDSLSGGGGYLCYATNLTPDSLTIGDKFVLSFDVKADSGSGIRSLNSYGSNVDTYYNHDTIDYICSEWKHIVLNKEVVAIGSQKLQVEFWLASNNNPTGTPLHIKNVMLTRGDKEFSATPAPEDVATDAQNKANAAQAAAEAVAMAQAALAKTEASAYADGIVTAEEQRAINDAKAKLDEAKRDAQAKADAAKTAAIEDAAWKYPTRSEVQSSITQTKDEINLSVTEKISNVQVGGRNLAVGSDIVITSNDHQHSFPSVKEWRGKYVTVSCYIEISNTSGSRIGAEPSILFEDGSAQYLSCWMDASAGHSYKGRLHATYKIHDKEIRCISQAGIYVQCIGDITKVGYLKVELGNKPTDWTPAPEDVQTQITANTSAIEVNKQGIALKASQTEVNGLGNRLTSAEGSLSVQAGQIAAQVSSVNALTGRMSSAEFALQPGNIWLGIKDNVQANIPNYVTQVDTRLLDPNKYYLVTIRIGATIPYTITVERGLSDYYGVPPYATHPAGFSVMCKWQSNGNGWGVIPVKRIIQSCEVGWSNVVPVGSISQITESSEEYIYVRGGSIYNVRIDGESFVSVALHTSTHHPFPDYPESSRPGVIDSVVTPIPDLDQKVTEEQVRAGIGITPGGITIFGQTISLSGAVTFSSLDTATQNTINSKATTGYVDSSKSAAIIDSRNNVAQNLGYASYADMESKAISGQSIITGGKIRTELVDARAIVTGVLLAEQIAATNISTGKLTVTDGARIGGMKVSGDSLTNEGFNNNAYIILRNDPAGTFAGIGANILPGSLGGARATGKFECAGYNYNSPNTAMILKASGSTRDNIALDMQGKVKTDGSFGRTCTYEFDAVWNNGWRKASLSFTNGILTDFRFTS